MDLRELLTGRRHGRRVLAPLDFEALAARPEWLVERALYASLAMVERLFPEAAGAAEAANPRCAARPVSCWTGAWWVR